MLQIDKTEMVLTGGIGQGSVESAMIETDGTGTEGTGETATTTMAIARETVGVTDAILIPQTTVMDPPPATMIGGMQKGGVVTKLEVTAAQSPKALAREAVVGVVARVARVAAKAVVNLLGPGVAADVGPKAPALLHQKCSKSGKVAELLGLTASRSRAMLAGCPRRPSHKEVWQSLLAGRLTCTA
mmetsp:Transcript_51291/g.119658  ORF Transcript_51291/g.119658 Transcript_51291/m.119658 type:complete len:186 (+) Transcript_51291:110-667(+)